MHFIIVVGLQEHKSAVEKFIGSGKVIDIKSDFNDNSDITG